MMNSDIPWTERELRRQIVRACQALSRRGLVAATDGNVSARLGPGRILVTPSGVAKGEVTEFSILLCDEEGRKVRGRGEVSSEIHVHLAAYRVRPDAGAGAVLHAHPPVANAFTFAGREALLLEPILPEVVAQIGPIPTVPYGTPGTRALAEAAAPHFRNSDVVLLARHGAVTLGPDPWQAFLRMEKLEQTATIVKHAFELAGPEGILRFDTQQIEDLVGSYGKMSSIGKGGSSSPADQSDEAWIERITEEVLKRFERTTDRI